MKTASAPTKHASAPATSSNAYNDLPPSYLPHSSSLGTEDIPSFDVHGVDEIPPAYSAVIHVEKKLNRVPKVDNSDTHDVKLDIDDTMQLTKQYEKQVIKRAEELGKQIREKQQQIADLRIQRSQVEAFPTNQYVCIWLILSILVTAIAIILIVLVFRRMGKFGIFLCIVAGCISFICWCWPQFVYDHKRGQIRVLIYHHEEDIQTLKLAMHSINKHIQNLPTIKKDDPVNYLKLKIQYEQMLVDITSPNYRSRYPNNADHGDGHYAYYASVMHVSDTGNNNGDCADTGGGNAGDTGGGHAGDTGGDCGGGGGDD